MTEYETTTEMENNQNQIAIKKIFKWIVLSEIDKNLMIIMNFIYVMTFFPILTPLMTLFDP